MTYKIVEISPEDAYFVSREHLLGIEMKQGTGEISENGWASGEWEYVGDKTLQYGYKGEVISYAPNECMYFYKVKLEKIVKQENK